MKLSVQHLNIGREVHPNLIFTGHATLSPFAFLSLLITNVAVAPEASQIAIDPVRESPIAVSFHLHDLMCSRIMVRLCQISFFYNDWRTWLHLFKAWNLLRREKARCPTDLAFVILRKQQNNVQTRTTGGSGQGHLKHVVKRC